MARPTKPRRVRGGVSYPCPTCHGPTHVLYTRRRGTSVFRVRKCRSCSSRVTTREERVTPD